MKLFPSAAITLGLIATPAFANFSKFMGDDQVTIYKDDQKPMCYAHVEFDNGGSISFARDLSNDSTSILILKPIPSGHFLRPQKDATVQLYIGDWGKADLTADISNGSGRQVYNIEVDGTVLFDRLAKSDGIILTMNNAIEAEIKFDGLPMPTIIDATNLCANS